MSKGSDSSEDEQPSASSQTKLDLEKPEVRMAFSEVLLLLMEKRERAPFEAGVNHHRHIEKVRRFAEAGSHTSLEEYVQAAISIIPDLTRLSPLAGTEHYEGYWQTVFDLASWAHKHIKDR